MWCAGTAKVMDEPDNQPLAGKGVTVGNSLHRFGAGDGASIRSSNGVQLREILSWLETAAG